MSPSSQPVYALKISLRLETPLLLEEREGRLLRAHGSLKHDVCSHVVLLDML